MNVRKWLTENFFKLGNLRAENSANSGSSSYSGTRLDTGVRIAPPSDHELGNVYHASAAVRMVVDKKADTIAAVPLVYHKGDLRYSNRNAVETDTGIVPDLFNRPNPYTVQVELIHQIVIHKAIYARAFCALEEDENKNPNLVVLDPRYVSLRIDNKTKFKYYEYQMGGEKTTYSFNQVAYFKDPGLTDPWFGKSKLYALVNDIDSSEYSKRATKAYFGKGKPLDVVYAEGESLSPDALAVLTDQYKQRTPESSNSFIVPSNYTPYFNSSNGTSRISEEAVAKLSLENVANVYGVPIGLFTTNDTGIDVAELEVHWWNSSLMYETKYISQEFNRLFDRFLDRPGAYFMGFDYDCVPALKYRALDATRIRVAEVSSGIKTPNEIRQQELNFKPYTGESAEFGNTPSPKWNSDMKNEASASLSLPGANGGRDQSANGEAQLIDQTGDR